MTNEILETHHQLDLRLEASQHLLYALLVMKEIRDGLSKANQAIDAAKMQEEIVNMRNQLGRYNEIILEASRKGYNGKVASSES